MCAYVKVSLACGNVSVKVMDTENAKQGRISVFKMMA